MTGPAPARAAALAACSDARRRAGRIRDIIRTQSAFRELSASDAALATRLAVGAVAARDLLDEMLFSLVKRPSSVEPRVLDCLRVSAFELLFLETPPEVAVSQGTELVRSVRARAAGLANAVLRRVAAEQRTRIEAARARLSGSAFDIHDLRLVSGLPAWLLARIAGDIDIEAAALLARSNLEPAPVYVFCEDAAALAPFSPRATDLACVYKLDAPRELYASGIVQAGTVVASDLAAQRICAVVADLCRAELLEIGQGGATKTLIIARRGSMRITAIDVHESKVSSARKRVIRAGLADRVTGLVFDGTHLSDERLPRELDRSFDMVFLDAPCSGTGTMRRHPEIASSLTLDKIEGLAALQSSLLDAASARVAPGGHLIYATCSVLAQENARVVDAFLASEAGASFFRVRDDSQTIPAPGSCDGHYCSVLARSA